MLASPEASFFGFQMANFLCVCPHVDFFLYVHFPGVFSSSYMDTSDVGLGSHPYDFI